MTAKGRRLLVLLRREQTEEDIRAKREKKRRGRDTLVGEKKAECRARFTTPGKRQMTLAQLRSARESRETSRRREGGVAIKELRVARWSLVVSAIGGVRETVKA